MQNQSSLYSVICLLQFAFKSSCQAQVAVCSIMVLHYRASTSCMVDENLSRGRCIGIPYVLKVLLNNTEKSLANWCYGERKIKCNPINDEQEASTNITRYTKQSRTSRTSDIQKQWNSSALPISPIVNMFFFSLFVFSVSFNNQSSSLFMSYIVDLLSTLDCNHLVFTSIIEHRYKGNVQQCHQVEGNPLYMNDRFFLPNLYKKGSYSCPKLWVLLITGDFKQDEMWAQY